MFNLVINFGKVLQGSLLSANSFISSKFTCIFFFFLHKCSCYNFHYNLNKNGENGLSPCLVPDKKKLGIISVPFLLYFEKD